MVVEDDPHSRSFMESSLQLSGCRVVLAADVNGAKEICRKFGMNSFIAVISDYRLPDGNGTDLIAWIRAQDECLSSILITGILVMNTSPPLASAAESRTRRTASSMLMMKRVISGCVSETGPPFEICL